MKSPIKRCMAGLLCTAVLLGMLPWTTAAEDVSDVPYYEETQTPAEPEDAGTVSVPPAEAEVTEITVDAEDDTAESELLFSEETEMKRVVLPAVTSINPLYEGLVTEEDLETVNTVVWTDEEGPALEEYLSFEEGCAVLREGMKNRQETTTVYIHLNAPTADEIDNLSLNVFNAALSHTGVPDEGDYLKWHWATRSRQISYTYLETTADYYFTLSYAMTYYTSAEQETAVDTAINELRTEIMQEDASDFEKVKAAYDWICANVTYDYDNLNDSSYTMKFTTYAALFDGTAVCQGYALLMYRLMLEEGIDCRLIAGDGGGAHAWNIVELNDVYYNVDATWDAGSEPENHSYFLLNTESFTGHTRYNDANYGYYDSEEFHAAYPMAEENYFSADDIRAGGTLDEDLGITWELTYGGTLILSGEGAIPAFTQTTEEGSLTISTELLPWGNLIARIERIVVSTGITSIGDGAFYGCQAAVSAEIADTVTEIGIWAFAGCSALEEIRIPASVTALGNSAFANCTALGAILFCGNAPVFDVNAFGSVITAAYYPVGNTTWTDDVMQNYGGTITWSELLSYEISNVEELYMFAALVNSGHTTLDGFLLNDITVNEDVLDEDGELSSKSETFRVWTPIGSLSKPYIGTFNGGGFTISGLYYNDTTMDRVGFFGRAGTRNSNDYTGLIKDLTLADSYISGKSSVGGIVGTNGGAIIRNCINHATVIAVNQNVGGIAGYDSGPVYDSVNTGRISGGSAVGGIAGQLSECHFQNCENSGTVTGSGNNVGGIIGYKSGYSAVSDCINSGTVSGNECIGGIIGYSALDSIEYCLNSGSVTGTDCVGGIVGEMNYGAIRYCFDHGTGSILGYNSNGNMSNCYYLAESETDSFDGTAAASFETCHSGKVAYLLGSGWGQVIGEEDFPVPGGAAVYAAAEGSLCTGYTNNADGIKKHDYENGVCIWCGNEAFSGDADGDGTISEADALYLLRYTILPECYPLNDADADCNGDEAVTAADAVYLLNHISDPENYPLP